MSQLFFENGQGACRCAGRNKYMHANVHVTPKEKCCLQMANNGRTVCKNERIVSVVLYIRSASLAFTRPSPNTRSVMRYTRHSAVTGTFRIPVAALLDTNWLARRPIYCVR